MNLQQFGGFFWKSKNRFNKSNISERSQILTNMNLDILRTLQLFSFLPLVSMINVMHRYTFIQSGQLPPSRTCVLNELQIQNRTTPLIGCGLKCNEIPQCIGFDLTKMDTTFCRLLSGFASLRQVSNLVNQTYRYQEVCSILNDSIKFVFLNLSGFT